MNLEAIIAAFGYPVLFAGVFLEGETVLILAGFMAHRGYLSLTPVLITAFLGAFLYTQLFFILGRRGEAKFIEHNSGRKMMADRIRSIMSGHETLVMLGYRFVYGTRTIAPFLFGLSAPSPQRFTYLNLIGTGLWTLIYGILGYLFGHIIEIMIKDIENHELWIIAGLIIVSTSIFLFHKLKLIRLYRQNTLQ
jgi:membrane protein DedA with SNARE-associated domain